MQQLCQSVSLNGDSLYTGYKHMHYRNTYKASLVLPCESFIVGETNLKSKMKHDFNFA